MLTREHVFGDWVSKIGLDSRPQPHVGGWLNLLGRDMGTRPPFQQVVGVCGPCNNGWMSRLEVVAKRVLTPVMLGEAAEISAADAGAISMWTQKTAMTAMLASPAEDRSKGYGLPVSEYRELYNSRNALQPLPASQFWVGRYNGGRLCSARVTPIVVVADGATEPDAPHGYVMTLIVGQLLLHGVCFTDPSMEVEVVACRSMPQLWPTTNTVVLPEATHLDDAGVLHFGRGADLVLSESEVELHAWKPAIEAPASKAIGDLVRLPTICGKHEALYPMALVHEARHSRFYAFVVTCECPMTYLIHTEPDGAHCKASGTTADITTRYEILQGEEFEVQASLGRFNCKILTTRSSA